LKLRRAGTDGRFAAKPLRSSWEEEAGKPDAVAEEEQPLEGRKLKGGTGRDGTLCSGEATDFHGVQSPEGERGTVVPTDAGPFEPTSGGQAGPRGERPCRERGNLRRAEIPRVLPILKHVSGGFGRKKAPGG